MSTDPDVLAARLEQLIATGARGRLLARGMARGLIWRDGAIPPGGQEFAGTLSDDLLDHGYALLALSLRLRALSAYRPLTDRALLTAAESIESVTRRGSAKDPARGFHSVVAAAAYHIAGFAARSFCLLPVPFDGLNLSSSETVLAFLMRRSFEPLREHCKQWLWRPEHQDAAVASRLADSEHIEIEDVVALAHARQFHRALAAFEFALWTGDENIYDEAATMLRDAKEATRETHSVPQWWLAALASQLADDLWSDSLHVRLPSAGPNGEVEGSRWEEYRRDFIDRLAASRIASIDLWPSQRDAARRAADRDDDLVVALPTSGGKTRIAELCILRAVADGKRAVYVTPLRALSAQIERRLARTFRPLGLRVSSLYGASGVSSEDVSNLANDQVVVATPEKLDFALRQQPALLSDVGVIVLDEGHMIGLSQRELRYEVLVQRLLSRPDAATRRIVCLSALFNTQESTDDFTEWIRSDAPGGPVRSTWRPTRQQAAALLWSDRKRAAELQFLNDEKPYVLGFVKESPPRGRGRTKAFPQDNGELAWATVGELARDNHRVLVYCPMRKSVETAAGYAIRLHKQGYLPSFLPAKTDLSRAEVVGAEWLGTDHVALKALRMGIALHHAGLPRPFLREIETLLDENAVHVLVASPTLAQGLDISSSALVLWSLYRGTDRVLSRGKVITVPKALPVVELANVIGRVGRAYADLDGITVLPAYDGAINKANTFSGLLAAMGKQSLESGILLLLRILADKLAELLNVRADALLEYVANQEIPWDQLEASVTPEAETGEAGSPQPARPIDELLADLDVAVFATVDDPFCDVSQLAKALDDAFKSSLWHRRLRKCSPQEQALQTALMHSRASWLWQRTSGSQRHASFSAGVGNTTCQFLEAHLEEIVRQTFRVDGSMLTRDYESAADAVVALGEILFTVKPFAPVKSSMPAEWRDVTRGWFLGVPLGELITKYGEGATDFVQDAVIYRLVWGMEAGRVYGTTLGNTNASLLLGIGAVALTYGVPSREAALLMQAGLSSRQLAQKVVQTLNANFENYATMLEWLKTANDLLHSLLNSAEWKEWMRFADGLSAYERMKWRHTYITVHATKWFVTPHIAESGPLRLLPSVAGLHVCKPSMEPIATVEGFVPPENWDHVLCYAGDEPGTFVVERYGRG